MWPVAVRLKRPIKAELATSLGLTDSSPHFLLSSLALSASDDIKDLLLRSLTARGQAASVYESLCSASVCSHLPQALSDEGQICRRCAWAEAILVPEK